MGGRGIQWQPVEDFPIETDLTPLVTYLRYRGVLHRVTEERGRQKLWVADPAAIAPLREFLRRDGVQSLSGLDPRILDSESPAARPLLLRTLEVFNRFPVTLMTIYFGILGALLVVFDSRAEWIGLFTFQPAELHGARLQFGSFADAMTAGQWWRLLTPVFLHFGLFHILFNALWLWEFGRRVELVFGSRILLLLLLTLGVISNLVQYLWTGPAMFGGLSGILYGLLGFLWMYNRRQPIAALALAPGIIGFMLFWQALCLFGVVDAFISGSVANGAHMGGLIAGMIAGHLGPVYLQKHVSHRN